MENMEKYDQWAMEQQEAFVVQSNSAITQPNISSNQTQSVGKKTKKVKWYVYLLTFILIFAIGWGAVFAVRNMEDKKLLSSLAEKIEVVGQTSTSTRSIYTSPLTEELSGDYLEAYNIAINSLYNNQQGHYRELVIRVALQVVQSNVLLLDSSEYYFSKEYTNSGSIKGHQQYSIVSYINLINSKYNCYVNEMGFARLIYSICAYAIDSQNPQEVSAFNAFYGESGAIQDFSKLSSYNFKVGSLLANKNVDETNSINSVAIYIGKKNNINFVLDYSGIIATQQEGGLFQHSLNEVSIYKQKKYNTYYDGINNN